MMKSHGLNIGVKAFLKRKDGKKELVWQTAKRNEGNKIIIENLDGSDRQEFPMKSFVSNFLRKYVRNMFNGFIYFNAPASPSGKFADGTTAFSGGDGNYGQMGLAGMNTSGIQVGFDPATTPSVDSLDYALKGSIVHGNGSGQLYKNTMQGTELGLDSFGSTTSEFSFQRDFINNSGADIDINECGFFLNYASNWSTTATTFTAPHQSVLMARDIFSPVTIPNGSGKRIRYTIQLDNSAGLGFNNNFLHSLRSNLSNPTSYVVKNVVGTVNYPYAFNPVGLPSASTPMVIGYEGLHYSGLVLSTLDSAFKVEDYSSTGLIIHGSTSGKLYHNAAVPDNYQDYDASETVWSMSREFMNLSGGAITPKSFMLLSSPSSTGTTNCYQIARGLINSGSGVTIPGGDSLIFEFMISVDVGV